MSDDYIKQIRKLIGHKPMLIPHAVVILFNEENRVLFEVRADDGYLDFPGGSVDLNEEVKETAKRELYEEIGCNDANLVEVGGFYQDPGVTSAYIHCFIATDLDAFEDRHLDKDEVIDNMTVSIDELEELIDLGYIEDASTQLTIYKALKYLRR